MEEALRLTLFFFLVDVAITTVSRKIKERLPKSEEKDIHNNGLQYVIRPSKKPNVIAYDDMSLVIRKNYGKLLLYMTDLLPYSRTELKTVNYLEFFDLLAEAKRRAKAKQDAQKQK